MSTALAPRAISSLLCIEICFLAPFRNVQTYRGGGCYISANETARNAQGLGSGRGLEGGVVRAPAPASAESEVDLAGKSSLLPRLARTGVVELAWKIFHPNNRSQPFFHIHPSSIILAVAVSWPGMY